MVVSDEIKILIKKFVFEGYIAKTLTDEFPQESWTKRGAVEKVAGHTKQAQLTGGQAAADRAVPAPTFCRTN